MFKMFQKVFHKYKRIIGIIDAITHHRIRIDTKELGYLWVSYHEIEPYNNQSTESDPKPKKPDTNILWHNQPLHKYKY